MTEEKQRNRKIFRYLLEINATSFKWYLLTILPIVILDRFVPFTKNLFSEAGLTPEALLGFLAVSFFMKLYLEKGLLFSGIARRALFYLKGHYLPTAGILIFIAWLLLQQPSTKSLLQSLNQAGLNDYLSHGLLLLLYLSIITAFFKENN